MSDREDQPSSTSPASSMSGSDEQPPAPPTSPAEGTYNETGLMPPVEKGLL